MQPGRDGKVGRYLRRNDKVWTPPTLITFDSESWRSERPDGEDQRLRLWCARMDDRRSVGGKLAQHHRAQGRDGSELARQVDQWCKGRETVWLYAHNLGYDLTTTRLIEYLCSMGWTVDRCSTIPEYLFLFLSNGRKRLTITDSHHMLPLRLGEIGNMLGMHKLSMPAKDAPDDDWFTYCARDVDVLASAVLTLMEHWDDYALGNWSISGAACGFRAMRHMMPPKSMVLIDDAEGSENDRAGIYGGRRYCWRHGQQPPGRYSELDFTQAHATVAANYPMPVKRGTWFNSLPLNHIAINSRLAMIIAEVEVETDVPRFPCRIDGRVWYPVGRFRTVLASPEIAWARELGCLRAIGRGQFHYLSNALRPFFTRVLDVTSAPNTSYHPLVRAMWKQWGRSVVGKFAQHGYQVTDTGMLTDKPWFYEKAVNAQTGEQYWLVHYDGTIHAARERGDGASAYPAVLALVESYERVAIGKAAERLGPDVIIQCDTDGLWADVGALEHGAATNLGFDLTDIDRRARVELAIDVTNRELGHLQLREKHSVGRMSVWGPQNYDAGNYTKHSGRPGRLTEVQDGIWAGNVFPAISHQMTYSNPGVYRLELVSWTRPACVIPAWVLDGGRTAAVEVAAGAGGTQMLAPFDRTRQAASGARLGPAQHPALDGLWTQVEDSRDDNASAPVTGYSAGDGPSSEAGDSPTRRLAIATQEAMSALQYAQRGRE